MRERCEAGAESENKCRISTESLCEVSSCSNRKKKGRNIHNPAGVQKVLKVFQHSSGAFFGPGHSAVSRHTPAGRFLCFGCVEAAKQPRLAAAGKKRKKEKKHRRVRGVTRRRPAAGSGAESLASQGGGGGGTADCDCSISTSDLAAPH